MGAAARALTLIAVPLIGAGCDRDPLVVLGDRPGLVRIVAGTPDEPGDSLGELGGDSRLRAPHGLAVGRDGTLYIADRDNSRILAVGPAGAIEAAVDHSRVFQGPRLVAPTGLALDGEDALLVADPVARRVWRVELPEGEIRAIAGSGMAGQDRDTVDALAVDLLEPVGVAVDSQGRVYISERIASRVRRLGRDGVLVTFAGSGVPSFAGDDGPARQAGLNRPRGLSVAGGTLYIADTENHRIRAVDLSSSVITTVAGTGDPGFGGDGGDPLRALLDAPAALSATADGTLLFIAEPNNHRIRLVDRRAARIATFAGTGESEFAGALRSAGETALSAPVGVATSPLELLFIADTGHHIVLRTTIGLRTAQNRR